VQEFRSSGSTLSVLYVHSREAQIRSNDQTSSTNIRSSRKVNLYQEPQPAVTSRTQFPLFLVPYANDLLFPAARHLSYRCSYFDVRTLVKEIPGAAAVRPVRSESFTNEGRKSTARTAPHLSNNQGKVIWEFVVLPFFYGFALDEGAILMPLEYRFSEIKASRWFRYGFRNMSDSSCA
jgi:hypothetical protein